MNTKLNRLVGSVAGVFCLLSASAAFSDGHEAELEATFSKLHKAIAAASACGDKRFSRDDYRKMSEVIDKAVNYEVGAGKRLTLIQGAKSEVRGLTRSVSRNPKCDSDEIKNMLIDFNDNLRPVF